MMADIERRPLCTTDEERRAALRRFVSVFKASRPDGARVTFEVSTTDIDSAITLFLKEPDMLFVVRDEMGAGQGIKASQLRVAPVPLAGMTEADEIASLRDTLGKLA